MLKIMSIPAIRKVAFSTMIAASAVTAAASPVSEPRPEAKPDPLTLQAMYAGVNSSKVESGVRHTSGNSSFDASTLVPGYLPSNVIKRLVEPGALPMFYPNADIIFKEVAESGTYVASSLLQSSLAWKACNDALKGEANDYNYQEIYIRTLALHEIKDELLNRSMTSAEVLDALDQVLEKASSYCDKPINVTAYKTAINNAVEKMAPKLTNINCWEKDVIFKMADAIAYKTFLIDYAILKHMNWGNHEEAWKRFENSCDKYVAPAEFRSVINSVNASSVPHEKPFVAARMLEKFEYYIVPSETKNETIERMTRKYGTYSTAALLVKDMSIITLEQILRSDKYKLSSEEKAKDLNALALFSGYIEQVINKPMTAEEVLTALDEVMDAFHGIYYSKYLDPNLTQKEVFNRSVEQIKKAQESRGSKNPVQEKAIQITFKIQMMCKYFTHALYLSRNEDARNTMNKALDDPYKTAIGAKK